MEPLPDVYFGFVSYFANLCHFGQLHFLFCDVIALADFLGQRGRKSAFHKQLSGSLFVLRILSSLNSGKVSDVNSQVKQTTSLILLSTVSFLFLLVTVVKY